MGNKQSILPETQGTVSMERYTSTVYKYGGGKYKTYTYISKEYQVQIDPSNSNEPITKYDPEFWTKITDKKETVQVPKNIVILAQEFLKGKEILTNEIQKTLDATP
jgi:hypothetical protein